jgi:hypothetical protein
VNLDEKGLIILAFDLIEKWLISLVVSVLYTISALIWCLVGLHWISPKVNIMNNTL